MRLAAVLAVIVGAFCPVGTHALAHAADSPHLLGHQDAVLHAHDHDAAGHHHEREVRDSDDVARIAFSGTKFAAGARVEMLTPAAAAPAPAFRPRLIAAQSPGPPLAFAPNFPASPSYGRAPPA